MSSSKSLPIDISNLSKSYGLVKALDDVSLNISAGEFLTLLGPSGSGKTTLLMALAGFVRPNSGSIQFGGQEVIATPPHERGLGMVFQSYALFPFMTVAENVAYPLKVRGVSKSDQKIRAERALETVQLGEYGDRRITQLSGGQRQRVAIGRALVREPRIFLFDEPLSNLDAKLRVEMRREIKKLHQQLKTTVVYVTHDQTEAMSLGTKIAIMNHGVIQQNDTPENIYNKPSNTFVADFIGSPSMNLIKGKLKENANNISFSADGTNIDIPISSYKFENTSQLNGKEVFFGIRPEHIHFKSSNEYDFEVNLKADLSEYIGHEQIITFNYSNQELLAKFPSTIKIELNKETKLYFDLTQVSLFDTNSKERI